MRFFRVVCCAILLLFCASFPSIGKSKKLTVLGTLTEDTPSPANNLGWTIQLNPVIMVDGRQITALEIKSSDAHRLVPLEDKFVQATGTLIFISSAESDQCPIFELSSIKEHKERRP